MAIFVSQIGKEVWVNSYPQFFIGVSQIGNEAWVSAEYVGIMIETASASDTLSGSKPFLVSQIGNENFIHDISSLRVTQIGNENFVNDPSSLRVTQIGNEGFINDSSDIRVTQIGNEIWVSNHLSGLNEPCNATDTETGSVANVGGVLVETCNATDTIIGSQNTDAEIEEPANADDFYVAELVTRGGLIINGWYTDSRGGIYYYYRDKDFNPGPRPPVTI